MTLSEINAAEAEAERIAHREVRFRWAAVVISCIAMMLSGIGLITVAKRSTNNKAEISRTRGDVGTAKTKADAAQRQTDAAQDTANEARRSSKRVVRYLQGKQGISGVPGANGKIGAPGPQGLAGASGPQGLQGPPGPAGQAGPRGPMGPIGIPTQEQMLAGLNKFCAVRECRGPTGEPGPQGPVGPPGPAGPQGSPGAPPPQRFALMIPGSNFSYTCVDPEDDRTYACTPTPPGG